MTDNSPNTEAGQAVPTRLADDGFYRALAARPRRRVLSHLFEESSSSRSELATVLAGWRAGESAGRATEKDYEQIVAALHHTHLPRLDDCGLIQYDRTTGSVTLTHVHEQIRRLIRQSIDAESTGEH